MTKTVKVSGLRDHIWTQGLSIRKQNFFPLACDVLFKEIRYESGDWTQVAQDRVRGRPLWTWHWTVTPHKGQGISWSGEWLSFSRTLLQEVCFVLEILNSDAHCEPTLGWDIMRRNRQTGCGRGMRLPATQPHGLPLCRYKLPPGGRCTYS
jgi:hypothetical protein